MNKNASSLSNVNLLGKITMFDQEEGTQLTLIKVL